MEGISPMALWGLIFVGAFVVLGGVIYMFGDRLRPLKGAERERSDKAARENWGKENVR